MSRFADPTAHPRRLIRDMGEIFREHLYVIWHDTPVPQWPHALKLTAKVMWNVLGWELTDVPPWRRSRSKGVPFRLH